MTRIAHLTDLHLLEANPRDRAGAAKVRLRYLSFFRKLDAEKRRQGALAALESARGRADHLVLTGDLTEEGLPAQFERMAELLCLAGWREDEVTMVPGNHDRYGPPGAWEAALEGPLAPWKRTSTIGEPVELAKVVLVPVDSSVPQSWVRSSGQVDMERVPDARGVPSGGRPVALAVHHPPFKVRTHRVHGLLNFEALRAHLAQHPEWQLLHGHTHRRSDRPVGDGPDRVRGNDAVVVDPRAVRLYEPFAGELRPLDEPAPLGEG